MAKNQKDGGKNWITTVCKVKKEVFQWRSNANISIAEPKTGVITTKALNISSIDMDIKGSKILLFLKPGIDKFLLVDKRFTIDIVVLIPA